MKKALLLWGLVLCCSACTAPSLRYKKDVSNLMASGQYKEAAEAVSAARKKQYTSKDADLFYLDRAVLLHDAGDYTASDDDLENAQYLIDSLYAKSVTGAAGRLVINDLTAPYYVSVFERALSYYYRMLNFLAQNNLSAALVEARKAVFFLDHTRAENKNGYNDDPFVQYFASLLFESGGQLDDARIARKNAYNAYERLGGKLQVSSPSFKVPADMENWGEVVVVSASGRMPLKKTATTQLAWDKALAWIHSSAEASNSLSPQVQNALTAGITGNAVTLSFPVWEEQPCLVQEAGVQINGYYQPAALMADVSAAAKLDLEEKMPGIMARLAARAVSKQVLAVQARHLTAQATQDDWAGELAGMFVSVLGASTEKADTRQWFTLPARIYLNRIFIAPGTHNITLFLRDRYGNIIEEKTFENVKVRRGGRVYLHYRTAR